METGSKHLQSGDVRQFPWLEAMVAALDDRLRLRHGVIEYTHSSDCLFRIQFVASSENYMLSDGTCIRPGDRLAHLHVWNEQFPCFAGKGPTLAWARRVNQAFESSLRQLADFLDGRRDHDDVVAICANMSLSPRSAAPSWRASSAATVLNASRRRARGRCVSRCTGSVRIS